jgi:hypothetical protein
LGKTSINPDIYLSSTHGSYTHTKCGYVVLSVVGSVLCTHYFLWWSEVTSPTKNFRENAKALRFDALIDKEEFMYKSEYGHNTPYNSTQEKEKLI